jgi:putative hydrolase of the HAD superfamily
VRAVIFDLWDTLVQWPLVEGALLRDRIAELVPLTGDEFETRWHDTYRLSQTGPLADAYLALGLPSEHLSEQIQARHDFGRVALRPRPGVVDVAAELRRRAVKTAVLSNCSEEVPVAWPASELAGLFDAETFSSECGLMKPDPEIYLRTALALGHEPEDCLFVGDGANNELSGAEQVGMRPVLFQADGVAPPWPEVSGWNGLRITTIEEVLELC